MVLWIVTGLALLIALVAWSATRRLTRRLDALNQSYWELRYEYTRLRSRVSRVDPDETEDAAAPPAEAAPTVSFVPLSSISSKAGRKKTDG